MHLGTVIRDRKQVFSDRSKMAYFSDLQHLSIPDVSLGDGAVVYHCRGR